MKNIYNHLLKSTGRNVIIWTGKDDGSTLGRFSFKPTHVYSIVKQDVDDGVDVAYVCMPLDEDEQFKTYATNLGLLGNLKARSLVKSYLEPAAARTRGLILGLCSGFFLTLGSIVTSLLLAQIALDKEKQREIQIEAEKAIATCTANQNIQDGDYSAAREQLNRVAELSPEIVGSNNVEQVIETESVDTDSNNSEPVNDSEQWQPQNTVEDESLIDSSDNSVPNGDSDEGSLWVPQ